VAWLGCPYLDDDVELTPERQRHIGRRHPSVSMEAIADTLASPVAAVRRPWLPDETLLIKEIDAGAGAKHIVVVVVRDEPQTEFDRPRHWVVTAYLAEALPGGVVEWQRS
jgi:hypothetical protein